MATPLGPPQPSINTGAGGSEVIPAATADQETGSLLLSSNAMPMNAINSLTVRCSYFMLSFCLFSFKELLYYYWIYSLHTLFLSSLLLHVF